MLVPTKNNNIINYHNTSYFGDKRLLKSQKHNYIRTLMYLFFFLIRVGGTFTYEISLLDNYFLLLIVF